MLNMLKRFISWFVGLFKKEEEQEDFPLYLACNGLYIARIESLERLIQQTEIDFAIGMISKEVYEKHFEEFRKQVYQLSADYARELLYSA